jgi:hypothetical protein
VAPPQRYDRPHVQLLTLLESARLRGLSFGEAWTEALRPGMAIVMSTTAAAPATAVRWPTDRSDRDAWKQAIEDSREAWRRAYYGQPATIPERSLVVLGDMLDSLDGLVLADGIGDRPGLASVA